MSRMESTPGELAAVHHDQMAEAAADHRLGRALERPVGRRRTSGRRDRWSATFSASGSCPAPIDWSTSRSVRMPGPGCSGSMTTAAPTLRSAMRQAAVSQRVTGVHRENHPAHPVPNLHPPLLSLLVTNDASYRMHASDRADHPYSGCRCANRRHPDAVQLFEEAVEVIEREYAAEDLSLRTVARRVATSRASSSARSPRAARPASDASSSACAWSGRPPCCEVGSMPVPEVAAAGRVPPARAVRQGVPAPPRQARPRPSASAPARLAA